MGLKWYRCLVELVVSREAEKELSLYKSKVVPTMLRNNGRSSRITKSSLNYHLFKMFKLYLKSLKQLNHMIKSSLDWSNKLMNATIGNRITVSLLSLMQI